MKINNHCYDLFDLTSSLVNENNDYSLFWGHKRHTRIYNNRSEKLLRVLCFYCGLWHVNCLSWFVCSSSRKHVYIILTPLNPTFIQWNWGLQRYTLFVAWNFNAIFLHNFLLSFTSRAKVSWHSNCHYNEWGFIVHMDRSPRPCLAETKQKTRIKDK